MSKEEFKSKILSILQERKLTKEELRKKLDFKGEENEEIFEEVLEELLIKEKIHLNDKGFYNIFDIDKALIRGKVYMDKGGKGHFVGKQGDREVKYLINNNHLNGALDGDLVLIRDRKLKRTYDLKLGAVEKILKRDETPKLFVYLGGGLFSFYNDLSDIYLKLEENDCKGLVKGTLVVAKVDENPIEKYNIYHGEITKICGHIDDPKSLVQAIGLKYGFDSEFCEAAIIESEKLPLTTLPEEIEDRVDLRDKKIFTLDGIDTKDIDDSISIEKDTENYIVRISIADVAHYIKKGSALDKEAYNRGNSAYPADMVLPMLPHLISNGICSLNPKADRLAITGEFLFNKDFEMLDFKMYESIINSKKQMTYNDVNKVLAGEEVEGYEDYKEDLFLLNKLSQKLEKERKANGALTFYDSECKIITDNRGKVSNVKLIRRGSAEKMIENLMILMNTEIANQIGYWGYQIMYRVHPEPDLKQLLITLETLKEQGIDNAQIDRLISELNKPVRGKEIKSLYIQQLLDNIRDEEYYETVSNLILRCMKRAIYGPENIGHFGLATENYIHFTSPIRRYADLINHRIAKVIMKYDKATTKDYDKLQKELETIETSLPEIGTHITETELNADKFEEEVDKIKQIEYFEEHIEDYEGPIKAKILRITRAGIFAKVEERFDIMIPIENLRLSNFKYLKETRSYKNKNETISLGDEIYVFDPEVFKERVSITYAGVSKDPNNLLKEETGKYSNVLTKRR